MNNRGFVNQPIGTQDLAARTMVQGTTIQQGLTNLTTQPFTSVVKEEFREVVGKVPVNVDVNLHQKELKVPVELHQIPSAGQPIETVRTQGQAPINAQVPVQTQQMFIPVQITEVPVQVGGVVTENLVHTTGTHVLPTQQGLYNQNIGLGTSGLATSGFSQSTSGISTTHTTGFGTTHVPPTTGLSSTGLAGGIGGVGGTEVITEYNKVPREKYLDTKGDIIKESSVGQALGTTGLGTGIAASGMHPNTSVPLQPVGAQFADNSTLTSTNQPVKKGFVAKIKDKLFRHKAKKAAQQGGVVGQPGVTGEAVSSSPSSSDNEGLQQPGTTTYPTTGTLAQKDLDPSKFKTVKEGPIQDLQGNVGYEKVEVNPNPIAK